MKTLLPLILFVLLAFSCKRDNDKAAKPSGDTDSVMLLKTVDSNYSPGATAYIDSAVYTYDDAGKIKLCVFNFPGQPAGRNRRYAYTRDGQERVVSVTRSDYLGDQPDSTGLLAQTTNFFYNGSSEQVSYYYVYFPAAAPERGDSGVVSYQGDNLSAFDVYPLYAGDPVASVFKSTWTFDGQGQLTTARNFVNDPQLEVDDVYRFDGKINPLKLGIEAVDWDQTRISAGNPVTIIATSPNSASSDTARYTYTYRPDGRPLSGFYSHNLGTDKTLRRWFYSR